MALPISVPYSFANATTSIPLSQLDTDISTVYAAVNGIGNGTVALSNVAITGGNGTFTTITSPASTNLTIQSASTTALTIDTSQNVIAVGTVAMASSFKRNRIINGNMNVAQRGTSFTDGNGYTLDRWYGNRSGGVAGVTYAQVYGAFGTTTNGMSIQRTSGNTSTAAAVLYQAIEGINSRDLAGKTITVSFQIGSGSISSTTGHSVIAYYQTTTTDIGPTSGGWTALTAQSFTVTASSSYTQKTFQFSIPSTATQLQLSIQFAFSGTAGADDRFYLTQVQLEQGSAATPYEMQIYSDQLAQCQRYYQTDTVTAAGTPTSSTNIVVSAITVPVAFRTAPSLSSSNLTSISYTQYGLFDSPLTYASTYLSSTKSFSFNTNNTGSRSVPGVMTFTYAISVEL